MIILKLKSDQLQIIEPEVIYDDINIGHLFDSGIPETKHKVVKVEPGMILLQDLGFVEISTMIEFYTKYKDKTLFDLDIILNIKNKNIIKIKGTMNDAFRIRIDNLIEVITYNEYNKYYKYRRENILKEGLTDEQADDILNILDKEYVDLVIEVDC